MSLFSTFFHSVFTCSSFQIPHLEELPVREKRSPILGISELEVFEALSSLDTTKAMGVDGIGPKILKHCTLALFKPLHHLFLLSLSQHCLPKDWRSHLIIPVFKFGDKSSVRNYCPISLLCSVSKVLEKLFTTKLSILSHNPNFLHSLVFVQITPQYSSCWFLLKLFWTLQPKTPMQMLSIWFLRKLSTMLRIMKS